MAADGRTDLKANHQWNMTINYPCPAVPNHTCHVPPPFSSSHGGNLSLSATKNKNVLNATTKWKHA